MTSINLPEPMQCPDYWMYTQDWQDQYENTHGRDYLSKKCKHSAAQFEIMYYICNMGEMALTKIKTQNLFIKRIATGVVKASDVNDHEIDWQSGHSWTNLELKKQALHEVYNAQLAPEDILKIFVEVEAFMDAGQSHCQSLLQYLTNMRLQEYEQARSEIMLRARPGSWNAVDVKHSAVKEGFVYLLSNVLMPGVYKIGFTAGNPDKRAIEIGLIHGFPMPFEVVEYWRTKDPYIVEQRIHVALASYKKASEFFEVDLQFAKDTIVSFVELTETKPKIQPSLF